MSDLKVVPFQKPSHHNLDNDQVIRLLKQALERAENGGCHSVAVILLEDEGNAIDCWHNGGRPYVMVGAMESLKTDFIHAHIVRRLGGNMQNPYVHYAGDGLGPRDVFVNGNPIRHVVYANQAKGVVEFAPLPLRVKRNGEIYTRKLHGTVIVKPQQRIGGCNGHS